MIGTALREWRVTLSVLTSTYDAQNHPIVALIETAARFIQEDLGFL